MIFNSHNLDHAAQVNLFKAMLWPRLIEEKMLILLRQGKISKWFSGIGQEAISAGAVTALAANDWIMPLHRNLAVFTGRFMPLHKLFMQWQGSAEGYSQARERSFHFGSKDHYICGMISHLGPQLSVACGAALAAKLRGEQRVAVAFTGDGGTSQGDFHEALNVASVWGLPVIFIIENNGYGLSTPVSEQYNCAHLVDRAAGYGIRGERIDGNNILEVHHTMAELRNYCIREQKPALLECDTFRMRGHEEASGVKYVPPELFVQWAEKDPVETFGRWLADQGILPAESQQSIRDELKQHIESELAIGFAGALPKPNAQRELNDVFAPSLLSETRMEADTSAGSRDMKFFEAIQAGLRQSMERQPELVIMGQDIAAYGGAFKITEGMMESFGPARIRNTPLCENAIVGIGLGLSLEGIPSIMEMQFADFVTAGFNQIVNNLAKIHYRWGQRAHMVIRMPTGAGVGAGPFHSQSNEAWFTHVAGLKVVYPSHPQDAKALLIAAVEDGNPVLYFEHKALYRSISGPVSEAYHALPLGKAALLRQGADATIITYGMGVHWAQAWMKAHPQHSISLLDLRSLAPLDLEAIAQATQATGKVLVLHEDTLTGGIGADVAAWIGQHCFEHLDAPVLRCASLDTPVPFSTILEKDFLASARLGEMMEKLLNY